MSRAAEGGALPEGVERALLALADAVNYDAEKRATDALRAAILAAIALPVAPTANICGMVRFDPPVRLDAPDGGIVRGHVSVLPPPVAPSCSASFDAALDALDVESDYAPDRGVTNTIVGLDDVRAAHAEAVRVAVEAEREACARACDERYHRMSGDGGGDAMTAKFRAHYRDGASECAAAIRARKEIKS